MVALSGITLWNLAYATSAKNAVEKAGFRERLHGMLLANCAFHDEMIHLYGGWALASGRSVCNGVIRASNGVLVNTRMPIIDTGVKAKCLKSLYYKLKGSGRGFLYVQLPLKIDCHGTMLPCGFARDHSHEIIDGFLKTLDSFQVPFVDVRGILDSTPDDVQRYFFSTDHHWNFDGAFKVFPTIARALVESLGAKSADIAPYISPDEWERKKLPRRFLGTDGRRTGALFAGTDEIFYYVPKFKTEISRVVDRRKISVNGSFVDSVLNGQSAEKPISMFLDTGYGIYGGDFDHVKYTNCVAPIKKNVLIVKDSYALPIIAWLTTIFERVDVVDLRYFKKMTLVAAVGTFKSDGVAIMYNPGSIAVNKMWQIGSVSAL